MKTTKIIALFATLLLTGIANAQQPVITNTTATGSSDSSKCNLVWSVGLSGTVIDDDGAPFADLFNVGDSWHFLPFPTRVHVDLSINPQWSFEGAFTYTRFKSGKVLNDAVLTKDQMFVAFDANARFHFIKSVKVFDPYGLGGLGFTFRSALQEQTPTLNVGLGTNIWFIETFGLNLQTSAKVKLNMKSSNYLMHSIGVVYRFK